MKTKQISNKTPGILLTALALVALSAGVAKAAYVDFTGINLTVTGSSFVATNAVGGSDIVDVTVLLASQSPGTTGSILGIPTGTDNGSLFALRNTAPTANGETINLTFSFASIQDFNLFAKSGTGTGAGFPSNISTLDRLTFTSINPLANWVVTGTNGLYSSGYVSGPSITIAGLGGTTAPFTTFNLSPDIAIGGFTLSYVTTASGVSPYNSAQFQLDVAVIPEPSTVLTLAAAGLAFTMYRFRRRRAM